jgi:hypothetical protein
VARDAKMKVKKVLALATGMVGFVAAAAVHAAPVTYVFSSGFVNLSAVEGSADLLPAGTQINLTGGQVTFDAAALTLPSFQFSDNVPKTIALTGPLTGENFTLVSLNVFQDATYSSSVFGTNPYNFSAGGIDASGVYSLSGTTSRPNTAFSGTNNLLTGQVTLGTDMFQLTGVTLGAFMRNGQMVTLKGDIVFEGAAPVPVPAAVWLFGSGLALLSFPLIARRREALSDPRRLQA